MNAPTPDLAAASLPCWSLEDLYSGPGDPRIEADFGAARKANAELATLEGQFLAARADPARLGTMIARGVGLYEDATNALWTIGAYAGLAASVSRDDPKWALFEGDVRAKSAAIGSEVVFFTLELNALTDGEIEAALAADPVAARWRPWLRRVRLSRPHELSSDMERLLVDRAPAIANWVRLYDDTLARLQARVGAERLTLSEALNRLSDPAVDRRRAAAKGLAKALAAREDMLALCYNTLTAEKQVEDRWRRYSSPIAGRNIANEVDGAAVEALEAAVVEAYPTISHRYYRLKAKVMGKTRLDHWDRNAPLTAATPRAYGWDEARGMVLDSFADLDPVLADRAKVFFERPWIDARPRPGKQSGAYSHSVTSTRHPYVFLNFMGERRDVLTLAHELGHAVHQTLAAPQGTLLADTPLTLAETASIFAEGLLFDRLLAAATPEDRRALLAGKIEDAINTVVRQIAFNRFESHFHAARKRRRSVGRGDRQAVDDGDGREPRTGRSAQSRLRALLGLCQPLRARAVLRLRLRLWKSSRRGADGGAATPSPSHRSTSACWRGAGHAPMWRPWRRSAWTPDCRASGGGAASGWNGCWTNSRRWSEV